MDIIDEFIELWKNNALEYYTYKRVQYKALENDNTPLSESDQLYLRTIGYANTERAPNYYRQLAFLRSNFGKNWKIQDVIKTSRFEELIKILIEKEGAKKKADFIAKIDKKIGKIYDANLMFGVDNGIEGYIEGEKGNFNVETIYAGGYNIQKLHYRILFKKVKPTK